MAFFGTSWPTALIRGAYLGSYGRGSMAAAAILARAHAAGLTLEAAGDRLCCRGLQPPANRRAHKPDLTRTGRENMSPQENEKPSCARRLWPIAKCGPSA